MFYFQIWTKLWKFRYYIFCLLLRLQQISTTDKSSKAHLHYALTAPLLSSMFQRGLPIKYCSISKVVDGVANLLYKKHYRVVIIAVWPTLVVPSIHKILVLSAMASYLIASPTILRTGPRYSSIIAMEQDTKAVAQNQ